MNYNESLKKVADYVTLFYDGQAERGMGFHNHKHTWELLDAINRISAGEILDDRSRFIVLTAAWFFDTGYCIEGTETPEKKSSEYAASFLQTIASDQADADAVRNCILSACSPQQPKNREEEIICDATMFYLAAEDFPEKNKELRKETAVLNGVDISVSDWREKTIALMESHKYFTAYGQQNLVATKTKNLQRLKKKQEEKMAEIKAAEQAASMAKPTMELKESSPELTGGKDKAAKVKKQKPEKEKDDRPVRGVETIFRISTANHQRFSSMADNKAHIMISVNSIVISVLLGTIVRKIDKYDDILVPTIMLLATNVTAIIFSVFATRPRLPKGYFTKEQVANKEVDLTFFGNFYKMNFEDYDYGMKQLMKDTDFIFGSLTRNVYGQAKVLGKKFGYLRISYNVFAIGLTLSVLAYILVFIFGK